MRRVRIYDAGTAVDSCSSTSSLATELRNLGLDDRKFPLLYSLPPTPTCATQRVEACGDEHSSGKKCEFAPNLRTLGALLPCSVPLSPAADIRMRTRLTPPPWCPSL